MQLTSKFSESSDCKWSNFAAVMRNDLSVRVRREVEEANNLVKQASLVSQKGGDLTPRGKQMQIVHDPWSQNDSKDFCTQ